MSERYQLQYIQPTHNELVVKPVSGPIEGMLVYTRNGLIEPFMTNERQTYLVAYFMNLLRPDEIDMLRMERENLSREALGNISKAVECGLRAVTYQKELDRDRFIKVDSPLIAEKLAELMPQLCRLLLVVKGEINVVDFLDLLEKKA